MTDAANTPRTAAGRALLYEYSTSDWQDLMRPAILAIEAEAAAPTPAELPRTRGDGTVAYEPSDDPTAPLDVLRQELADMEAVGWPATSHEYRRGVRYAINRLAAARPEAEAHDIAAYARWRRDPNRITADDVNHE